MMGQLFYGIGLPIDTEAGEPCMGSALNHLDTIGRGPFCHLACHARVGILKENASLLHNRISDYIDFLFMCCGGIAISQRTA